MRPLLLGLLAFGAFWFVVVWLLCVAVASFERDRERGVSAVEQTLMLDEYRNQRGQA